MASLRVRRTWWIMQLQTPEAPLFRVLARRWRPVDRRERSNKAFQLALSPHDAQPPSRNSFGPKARGRDRRQGQEVRAQVESLDDDEVTGRVPGAAQHEMLRR